MKKLVAQLGLVIVLIVLGVFLFVTGREHKVFVENKSVEDYKALKEVHYVKGGTHEIVVTYEKDGESYQIEKSFKLKVTEEALISIPALIGDSEKWIEFKRP